MEASLSSLSSQGRKPISISDYHELNVVELIRDATLKRISTIFDGESTTGLDLVEHKENNDNVSDILSQSFSFLDGAPALSHCLSAGGETVQSMASATSHALLKELAASFFSDNAVEVIRASTAAVATSHMLPALSENEEEDLVVEETSENEIETEETKFETEEEGEDDLVEAESAYEVVQEEDYESVIHSISQRSTGSAEIVKGSSSVCTPSVAESTDLSSVGVDSQESSLQVRTASDSVEMVHSAPSTDPTRKRSEESILVGLLIDDGENGSFHSGRETSSLAINSIFSEIVSKAEDVFGIQSTQPEPSNNGDSKQLVQIEASPVPSRKTRSRSPTPKRPPCPKKTGDVFVVSDSPATKSRRNGRLFGIGFGRRRNRSGLSSVSSKQSSYSTQYDEKKNTSGKGRMPKRTTESAAGGRVSAQGSRQRGVRADVARSGDRETPKLHGQNSRLTSLGGMAFEESIQSATDSLDGLDFSEAYSAASDEEESHRDSGISMGPVISYGTQDMAMPNGFCHLSSLDGGSVVMPEKAVFDLRESDSFVDEAGCTPNLFFITSVEAKNTMSMRDEDGPEDGNLHYFSSDPDSESEEEEPDEDGEDGDDLATEIINSVADELRIGNLLGTREDNDMRLRTRSNGLASVFSGDSIMSSPEDPIHQLMNSYTD